MEDNNHQDEVASVGAGVVDLLVVQENSGQMDGRGRRLERRKSSGLKVVRNSGETDLECVIVSGLLADVGIFVRMGSGARLLQRHRSAGLM